MWLNNLSDIFFGGCFYFTLRLDTVTEMWEKTTDEFDRARQTAKKARNAFLKVKEERYKRFMKCFDHINSRIDDIYKALCMNQGAQASLVLENAEEPYTEGNRLTLFFFLSLYEYY
jgi:structural maintenance of chromosome 1